MVVFGLLFVGLLLVVPDAVLAQSTRPFELQWSEVYADFFVCSIVQAQDDGFMIAGYTTTRHFVSSLIKVNSGGDVEWLKTYPEITASPRLQVVDSGYILSSSRSGWLKTDLQGNIQWSKQFGFLPERASIPWVILEEDDSYVMLKSGYSIGRTSYSLWKYGVDDVLLWDKYVGEAGVGDVLLSSGDGYYVVGTRDQKGWFTKWDLEGEVVWSRTYNYKTLGEASLVFVSIIETLDGGFLLIGYNDRDSWVVKTDRNGREQWHRQYDRYVVLGDDVLYNYDCSVRCVVEVGGGGYLVFRGMEVVVLGSRGNELGVGSYFEYDSELDGLGVVRVESVVGVVGDDGCLVVAVTYRTATHSNYPGLFDGPSYLWVAGFALEPTFQSDDNVLLFGVVAILVVVVLVFVCFWFLKNKKVKCC